MWLYKVTLEMDFSRKEYEGTFLETLLAIMDHFV